MLWTLRPRLWEGPGADAARGGPGGLSLWGEVSGVVGWEVCPPASRARRLRRIYNRRGKGHSVTERRHSSPENAAAARAPPGPSGQARLEEQALVRDSDVVHQYFCELPPQSLKTASYLPYHLHLSHLLD